MFLNILTCLSGIFLLFIGAERLVHTTVKLAQRLHISIWIISLTLVAFATSLPEAVASVIGQFSDLGDIALGNVLGSNIANISLVLGVALLIRPAKVTDHMRYHTLPLMLGTALLLWLMLLFGSLSVVAGSVMGILFVSYLIYSYKMGKKDKKELTPLLKKKKIKKKPLPFYALYSSLFVLSIAALVAGAHLLITSGIQIAETLGVSRRVIAITLVALGTSLPELATVIVAAYKKESALILGNVIGSNLFNTLFIIPLAICIHPIIFSKKMAWVDAPFAFLLAALLFALSFFNKKLGRLSGAILLIPYLIYILLLF